MTVSVIMTVYNGAWCVTRALDSVLAQTRRPEEILVCDDGSTDGTPELVAQRYGSAVRLERLPHRGAAATRRAALDRAGGDWFAFLDADDTWVPEKHERQLAFVAAHPEVRMVQSDGVYLAPDRVIRDSWLADYFHPVRERVGDLFPLLVERCFTLMSSTLLERRAYEEAGGLDPAVVYSYDYDLWLRVAARFPTAVMADPLITYLWTPGAMSQNIEARYRDDLMLMRRVEAGALGGSAAVRGRAAERAAGLEFDLGLMDLRAGRLAEARGRLRRALSRGPLRRRLFAAAGLVAPGWAFRGLMRSGWLKGSVQAARMPVERIEADREVRGAA